MTGAAVTAATGVGSLPGTDVRAAVRLVVDALPDLPHLPELPARGPGADLIGRGAGLLVDLPVDLQPSGWRLVDHPGRDLERTRAWLRQDLDVLAEVGEGYEGPFKLQVTGPWTLAAQLWLPRLERALVDPGACRDLAASLAEGLRLHVEEVRRLLPGATVVVQVDEPSLQDVIRGALPTASGFGRLRAVEEPVLVEALQQVLEAAAAAGAEGTVVHCCAAAPPVAVIERAAPGAISLDLSTLGAKGWESVAVAVEAGTALWAGAVPTTSAAPRPDAIADGVTGPWSRLGLDRKLLAGVVVTPACGLVGASPAGAAAALRAAKDAAELLAERAED